MKKMKSLAGWMFVFSAGTLVLFLFAALVRSGWKFPKGEDTPFLLAAIGIGAVAIFGAQYFKEEFAIASLIASALSWAFIFVVAFPFSFLSGAVALLFALGCAWGGSRMMYAYAREYQIPLLQLQTIFAAEALLFSLGMYAIQIIVL